MEFIPGCPFQVKFAIGGIFKITTVLRVVTGGLDGCGCSFPSLSSVLDSTAGDEMVRRLSDEGDLFATVDVLTSFAVDGSVGVLGISGSGGTEGTVLSFSECNLTFYVCFKVRWLVLNAAHVFVIFESIPP